MRISYSLLLTLFISIGAFSQNHSLVFDCKKDSNDYVSNLKVVNEALFFNSGKVRNPKGVFICGNGGPREFRERHVYQLEATQSATKIFHHDLENDFAQHQNQQLDSSNIFAASTYFPFSDSSGIFLSNSSRNDYWIKGYETQKELRLDNQAFIFGSEDHFWTTSFQLIKKKEYFTTLFHHAD